jgi:hypothetical protein
MLSMFWRDLFKFGISTLMLSIRIRNWCQCSGYATVPDAHAQCTHQFLTCMLTRFWRDCTHCTHLFLTCMLGYTHQFLACMLSICISSWSACSVHTLASYMHIEGIKTNIWKMGKLIHMLSMCNRNWCVWSGCASVPDMHAQHAHKGWSMHVRK